MKQPRSTFFDQLFETSLKVVAGFPITSGPAKMDYIVSVLEPAVVEKRRDNPFTDPPATAAARSRHDVAVGMNTLGMLLDRLSILSIKHWNLEHRSKAPDKARHLASTQIAELIEALLESRPGQSSINNKMTNRKVEVEIGGFSGAFWGLLTTNLLLWEAQEILYNHDISVLPCEELRAYIDFFSRGNIARNEYIQASDVTYWQAVQDKAGL